MTPRVLVVDDDPDIRLVLGLQAEAAELGVDTFAKTATDELVTEVRTILAPSRSWWQRLLRALSGDARGG